MSKLADRVRYAMRKAGFTGDEEGRPFGRYCKLKSESQINHFLSGIRESMSELTARKIGKATNVSWWWLKTGHGSREPYEGDEMGPVISPPPPHGVEQVATAAEARCEDLEIALRFYKNQKRWSDPVIAAARVIAAKSDEEFSPPEWAETLDRLEAAFRAAMNGETVGDPVESDSEPPPPRGKR